MTFKRKEYPRYARSPTVPLKPEVTAALQRQDGRARLTVPVPRPKEEPVRDEAYRRWVASLDCAHCSKGGPSQCAHGDFGKGTGIKTSDETCYPLCPPCHTGIGSAGWFRKEHRRTLELDYAERTRQRAAELGLLPVKGEK